MARITFSIPTNLADGAEKRAKSEKRTLSSYISVLVERDLIGAGLIKNPDSPTAQLIAAANRIGLPRALDVLANARRPSRRTA